MRTAPRMRFVAAALIVLAATGCASSTGPVVAATYGSMSCADLNTEMGVTAAKISRAAISRGNITNTKLPSWFSVGNNAASVLADRQTARIDRLRQEQAEIDAARKRQCQGQS